MGWGWGLREYDRERWQSVIVYPGRFLKMKRDREMSKVLKLQQMLNTPFDLQRQAMPSTVLYGTLALTLEE